MAEAIAPAEATINPTIAISGGGLADFRTRDYAPEPAADARTPSPKSTKADQKLGCEISTGSSVVLPALSIRRSFAARSASAELVVPPPAPNVPIISGTDAPVTTSQWVSR